MEEELCPQGWTTAKTVTKSVVSGVARVQLYAYYPLQSKNLKLLLQISSLLTRRRLCKVVLMEQASSVYLQFNFVLNINYAIIGVARNFTMYAFLFVSRYSSGKQNICAEHCAKAFKVREKVTNKRTHKAYLETERATGVQR